MKKGHSISLLILYQNVISWYIRNVKEKEINPFLAALPSGWNGFRFVCGKLTKYNI